MNDFLISRCIPGILYSNMLTFRESEKSFKLDGDLLRTLTKYNFDVTHSNPPDIKLLYEFEQK